MTKKVLAIFLAIIMLLSLSACTQNDVDNDLEKVTISIHPSGHGLPAYVAEQNGYYEEEGLDVETLVYIAAPPQMEAYQAGSWDIGTTGFGGIILGVAKKDLKIIGVSIDDGTVMGLWSRPDSAIVKAGYNNTAKCYGTAADWKNLEILYAKGTITDILLMSTLEKLGLTVDDVVGTNMDASPAFTAYRAGSGDLVQANASFYFNAEEEGWVAVTTGEDQELFMPSVLVASDKILSERPEVVAKWTRAYMKGVEWIKNNPDEAAEMFVEFCDENGVATDLEKAKNFIDKQIAKIPDAKGQMELFERGADGLTKWQSSLAHIMDYYIKMGNYTENDKAQLLLDENYDSSFMESIAK